MSDYPHTNINRGNGVSGRGLLAAAGVIIFAVVVLAILGANNAPPANEATAPIAEPADDAAPIVAPVGTD